MRSRLVPSSQLRGTSGCDRRTRRRSSAISMLMMTFAVVIPWRWSIRLEHQQRALVSASKELVRASRQSGSLLHELNSAALVGLSNYWFYMTLDVELLL